MIKTGDMKRFFLCVAMMICQLLLTAEAQAINYKEKDTTAARLSIEFRRLYIDGDEKKLYAKAQEAEGIRKVGEAEAAAIAAKGLAEAEALEKKAEAMKKYGQAAMMEMIVKALPEMAAEIAKPLSTIDKVTIIDSGNSADGTGVSSMGSYVPSVLAQTIESVKETTGIDIREIMRANTYDAKVNKNITVSGLENVQTLNVSTGEAESVSGAPAAPAAPTTPTT